VRSEAVLIAIASTGKDGGTFFAVELANRESLSSWKELLAGLRQRSRHGVEFVASDDHAGLRRAIQEAMCWNTKNCEFGNYRQASTRHWEYAELICSNFTGQTGY
jgi:predicted secreted protein